MSRKSSRRAQKALPPPANGLKFPPWIIRDDTPTAAQLKILDGLKLMVGTPMYGGLCYGAHSNAIANLKMYGDRINVDVTIQTIYNESLIQRARNAITYIFEKGDCDYLLFIDADIAFYPIDALSLLLAAEMQKEDLVGATYSKKGIPWEKVGQHLKNRVRTSKLPHCLGDHVIRPIDPTKNQTIAIHDFLPVTYLGTGFMLISRKALTKIRPACKDYRNNHILGYPVSDRIVTYFDCEIRDDSYLSEDYLFCARAVDVKIIPKLAPWINLVHFGTYPFEGCFACSQQGYVHDVREPGSLIANPHQSPSIIKETK